MAEAEDSNDASPKMVWKPVDEGYVDSFWSRARQGIHCSLFCGGVKCKHEDWTVYQKKYNMHTAITGLNSSWVGDCVVASQRPSTSLFLKFQLVQQFKDSNITGVFNLQEKGEHASCGPDGIYPVSGYSYHGETDLMRHSIYYYEFPWPDMTAPDNDVVLRSVQCMDFHIRNHGKVLVHCHAGLGRTGLMIASYFVYSQRMSAADAIKLVRESRPGAVQTSKQQQFVHSFEKHLWSLFQAFRVGISDSPIELHGYIKRQRLFLHGEESRLYKYVPKHTHLILCRLISLTASGEGDARTCLELFSPAGFSPGYNSPGDALLGSLRLAANHGMFDPLDVTNIRVLSYLLFDWFRSMSEAVLDTSTADGIIEIIKSPPSATSKAQTAALTLPLLVKHTIGMLLSGIHILGRNVPDKVRRYAVKCATDAFLQAHDPTKVRHSSSELSLLYDLFYNWAAELGSVYFDDSQDPQDSIVTKIALASQIVLRSRTLFSTPRNPKAEEDFVAQDADD